MLHPERFVPILGRIEVSVPPPVARGHVQLKPLGESRYHFVVQLSQCRGLLFVAPRRDAGDGSRLLHPKRRVEEQVRLPILRGPTARREHQVQLQLIRVVTARGM